VKKSSKKSTPKKKPQRKRGPNQNDRRKEPTTKTRDSEDSEANFLTELFAARMREARKKKGLKQSELAELLGWSRITIVRTPRRCEEPAAVVAGL